MNINKTKNKLELLLDEKIDSICFKERSLFDQLSQSFEKSLVLYGAGNLGKKTLTGLRSIGIDPHCFVDRNQSLWNSSVDG